MVAKSDPPSQWFARKKIPRKLLALTIGIGGAVISWGNFSLAGIGLAAVAGILLNLILPGHAKQVVVKETK